MLQWLTNLLFGHVARAANTVRTKGVSADTPGQVIEEVAGGAFHEFGVIVHAVLKTLFWIIVIVALLACAAALGGVALVQSLFHLIH